MALLERHSIANSGIVADPLVQALLLRLSLLIQQRGWRARSFQCRAHEIMLFDGNKNGSKTHDDPPLGFVALHALIGNGSGTSKKSFIASLRCGLPSLYPIRRWGGHDKIRGAKTKVVEFHSDARGPLFVRLTLYREHGVSGR